MEIARNKPLNEPSSNASGGFEFPLTYTDPFATEKIYWICDRDADGKLTSVFFNASKRERQSSFYEMENVIEQEKMLKEVGWVKCKQPEINIKVEGDKVPRKLRRRLAREEERKNKKK